MRRLLQRGLSAATVTCGLFFAGQALAGGSGMPWEGPLQQIVESITGPVVQAAAVVAVVLFGAGVAMSENGSSMRRGLPRAGLRPLSSMTAHGCAATEGRDQRCRWPEHRADILLAVGADHGRPDAAVVQPPQKVGDAFEQRDLVRLLGHSLAQISGDPRQAERRHAQRLDDVSGRQAPKTFDLRRVGRSEAMGLGEARQLADEPGRAVGEHAVEVEEDEFVLGHSDRHSGNTVGGHGVPRRRRAGCLERDWDRSSGGSRNATDADDLRTTVSEPELGFVEQPVDNQDAVGLPVVDQLEFLAGPDEEGRRLIDRGSRRQGDEGRCSGRGRASRP